MLKWIVLLCILCGLNTVLGENRGFAFITFEKSEQDLGSISPDQKFQLDYNYSNTGTMPLVITKVDVSCGCIKPQWSSKPLMPGEKEKIKVFFDPKTKKGTTRLSIYVNSNAKNKLEIIRINAVVK